MERENVLNVKERENPSIHLLHILARNAMAQEIVPYAMGKEKPNLKGCQEFCLTDFLIVPKTAFLITK